MFTLMRTFMPDFSKFKTPTVKFFGLGLGLVLFLSACAGQPAYRAAERGGFGYSERQITDEQYRVNFKARGDNIGMAVDYAMLRAAEITLERGYDWFRVTNRETFVDRERVSSSHVGFGMGYPGPFTRYHLGMTLGDGRSEVEVNLEIRLGRGPVPDDENVFKASEVFENLRPRDDA